MSQSKTPADGRGAIEQRDPIVEAAHRWRARIDDGGLNARGEEEFARWIAADPHHAAAYAEAEILWKALGAVPYDPVLDRPIPGERSTQTDKAIATDGGWWTRWLDYYSRPFAPTIAAGLLIVAVALAFYVDQSHEAPGEEEVSFELFDTAQGESRQVTLADGSEMNLGPATRVEVTIDGVARRAVLMTGHAYFAVTENLSSPFSVSVGAARVEVTGTAFDLQRRGDRLAVAVAEGQVQVSHPRILQPASDVGPTGEWSRGSSGFLESTTLSAGQTVTATRGVGLSTVGHIDVEDVGAWRFGQLVYVDARLADVVADLNRYSAEFIALDDAAANLELSGTFTVDDLSSIIDALQAALPVELLSEKDGQRIRLKPEA
ncbi:MAG: FecR domain-containing protein [Pseudomonadota bacterium]